MRSMMPDPTNRKHIQAIEAAWHPQRAVLHPVEVLREVNRAHGERVGAILRRHRESGAFRRMPGDCFLAVVIGPCHDMARNWLAGRSRTSLADCRELLADIAWVSVRA